MSYILDALRKAETERRGVSLGNHVTPRSRVPFKALVSMLVFLNAALIGWLLMDPMKTPSVAEIPVETGVDQITSSNEILRTKLAESVTGSISTPRLPPPEVSAAQEASAASPHPELVYYRDFEGVVGDAFPSLAITIHTYTDDPRERAIHIGRNIWREGDAIHDGMVLRTITEKGIEVTYRDYLVIIDVLDMWDSGN